MPPKIVTDAQMPRYDPYAWARCSCGHLQYADEQSGGKCRFCPCESHSAPGVAA